MDESKSGEVFELHRNILALEARRRALTMETMEKLIKMQYGRDFCVILGDNEADWSAYLAEVGIFYSRAQVRRWKRIFEFFDKLAIDKALIFEVPESRLEQIALAEKYFKDKDHVLETLESAKVLLPRDWKNFMLSLRGKPTTDDCKHHFRLYELCPDCGEKHQKV